MFVPDGAHTGFSECKAQILYERRGPLTMPSVRRFANRCQELLLQTVADVRFGIANERGEKAKADLT